MNIDLSRLNENQLEAVQWQDKSLLVLAGPGSGKTRVLTYRIARIISESSDKYFKVLALTFTNKAAAEMRERVQLLVPNISERVLLTTFHSFAADLLRQHGHHIGLRPDFTILTQDAEREAIIDEIIEELLVDDDNVRFSGEKLLPMVNRLLDSCIEPESAADFLSQKDSDEVAIFSSIYGAYRKRMIEKNSLDFGGLIAEALMLLEKNQAVKKQIHRIYKYICVDEFQDTNLSQYKILCNLVDPKTKNLFVVADDDQIIYQWNGASPERLQSLQNDFNMTILQLPENFRCPPDVIEVANKLIVQNIGRSADKQMLRAFKTQKVDGSIRIHNFDTFDHEKKWLAKDIKKYSPEDRGKCVVLARTRKVLEQVIHTFNTYGIPSYLAFRKDEFVSTPLSWLHAILRLANSRQEREQLRRLCKMFFTLEGISINVKDVIANSVSFDGDYLRTWLSMVLQRTQLEPATRQFLEKSLPLLIDRLDFWSFSENTFNWFDILESKGEAEKTEEDSDYPEEKGTWKELVAEIASQYGKEQVSLHLLLQELDLRSKSPKPLRNAVPCLTIHGAKGMEFDHVYLIGMVEDQLPSWAAIKKGDNSHEMQEERRNCFVAITRTQETLTLTYSKELYGWPKKPSRFLYEMALI